MLQLGQRSELAQLLRRALPEDAEGYLAVVNQLAPLSRDGLLEFLQALEQTDPKLDKRALETIAEHRANSGIPLLLLLMEGPDLDGRTRAVKLLRALTRKNFGYDPAATTKARRARIHAWRQWWQQAARGFGR